MNEVELIRAQLSVERQHAAEVSGALAAAGSQGGDRLGSLEAFRQASVDYLVWILSRFEEREQVFHDLLRSRLAADDPKRLAVETALARAGTSREALAKLESALRAGTTACVGVSATSGATSDSGSNSDANRTAGWSDFVRFFDGAWSARRDELDKLFAQQAKITDWRAVSGIDADSIFDERSRYARVREMLPGGVEMSSPSSHV
jgi:hypothetical protein